MGKWGNQQDYKNGSRLFIDFCLENDLEILNINVFYSERHPQIYKGCKKQGWEIGNRLFVD